MLAYSPLEENKSTARRESPEKIFGKPSGAGERVLREAVRAEEVCVNKQLKNSPPPVVPESK